MSKKNFSFRIGSDTSKEKVFVEVFYGDDQLAELSQEEPDLTLSIVLLHNKKYWKLPLEEALQEAKKSLL